jgi:hypothetical protein
MADDPKLELLRAHRTATDKYVYFLLAAAGACIAFAINQTKDAALSWSQIPLAAAVLCWALSIFFGCRQITGVLGLIQENYQLTRTMLGEHPDFPPAAQFTGWVEKRLDEKSKRAAWHGELQFGFLLAGAALYIVWHAIEMYLRTAA